MKTSFFIVAFLFLATSLFSQNPTVKIELDGQERFRFDSIQLIFTNSSHHVMIGDSVGMNNIANDTTEENTFLGFKAGSINHSGWNTFLGARAGENHKVGDDNVYLGTWAGRYDSLGLFNTYVGANSGLSNKTGQRNTFVGRNTGIYSDSCSSNTLIGYNAGYYLAGGQHNVFVGRTTGGYSGINGAVNHNTYLGSYAGFNNQDGENNVFIGFNAGRNETGSNILHIANNDTSSLVYGEFDNPMIRFNVDRVDIVNPLHNVLIGDSCGWNINDNPEAVKNVFIGYQAGYNNTSGRHNIFIGDSSGYFNTTGYYNTAIGSWSAWNNTEGQFNAFYGLASGPFNTTGRLNSYFGTFSGYENDTGIYNCFYGYATGAYNHGSFNVFLGGGAGRENDGDSSVMIGHKAGWYSTGSNKLYIANSETMNPLVYGEFDNQIIRFNARRIELSDGSENTFVGDSTGVANEGTRNVFMGYKAGYNTNSDDNVLIGYHSGSNTSSGYANTMVGTWAGEFNDRGRYNVFVGFGAGAYNDTANFNVFVGSWAGLDNTSGKDNTFLGTSTGANNTTGLGNTYLGRRAGYFNETGDSNVFIGNRAGFDEMGSHRLYVANSETPSPLIYGEFDNELLRIHGTLDIKGLYQFPITDGTTGQFLQTDGAGTISWSEASGDFSNGGEAGGASRILGNTDYSDLSLITNNNTRLFLSKDGNVGIGTDDPFSHLEVVKDQGVATITATSYREANFNAGQFIGRGARGTKDSPLAVQEGDMLASFNGRGYGATGFSTFPRGRLGIVAAENFTDSEQGTHVTFWTTPVGTTTSTESFRITSEGDVGIGTTDPGYKLHLSSDNHAHIYLENSGDNEAKLFFDANRLNNDNHIGQIESRWAGTTVSLINFYSGDDDTNKDEGYIAFETKSTTLSEKMRITKDGNVGVGVTDPSSLMDINGSSGYGQLRLRNDFTPASSADGNGETGDVAWDDNYIYIKTSTGWKRAALSTFP